MGKTYLKDLTPEEVIRRLKAGEVLKEDDSKTITKLVDGVWCTYCPDGSIWLNDGFNLNDDARQYNYFETPDELKLEVGKCYRTRDGRKAFVSYYVSSINKYVGIIYGENTTRTWNPDGECSTYCMNNDLISEWNDDEEKEND